MIYQTICLTIVGVVLFGVLAFILCPVQTDEERNRILNKIKEEKEKRKVTENPKLSEEQIDKILSEDSYLSVLTYIGSQEYWKISQNKLYRLMFYRGKKPDHLKIEYVDKSYLETLISLNGILKIEIVSKENYEEWLKIYNDTFRVGDRVKIKIPESLNYGENYEYHEYFTADFFKKNLIHYFELKEGAITKIIDEDTFPVVIVKFDNWPDPIGMKYAFLEKIIDE